MKKATSLASINKHIQKYYPLISLVKGNGYHWIHSSDDRIAIQLAGLYTTSIDVPRIAQLTPDEWLERVNYVLADSYRLPFDRMPVKFPINQPDYRFYVCELIGSTIRINEGFVEKVDATERLNQQKEEGHADGLVFKVISGRHLKTEGIDPYDDTNWDNPSYMR